MFCGNCGNPLEDGVKYCKYCGAPTEIPDNEYRKEVQGCQTGWQQQGYCNPGYRQQINPGQGYQSPEYQQANPGPGYESPEYQQKAAGRKRRGSGTKIAILAGVLVCAAAVIVGVFFYLRAGSPEFTVAKLEKSLNKLDLTEMVECFDSDTREAYRLALKTGADVNGLSRNSLIELASGFGSFMQGTGLLPSFEIEVQDVEYEGKKYCTVYANMSITYNGETKWEEVEIPMFKEGNKWVIDGGEFGF